MDKSQQAPKNAGIPEQITEYWDLGKVPSAEKHLPHCEQWKAEHLIYSCLCCKMEISRPGEAHHLHRDHRTDILCHPNSTTARPGIIPSKDAINFLNSPCGRERHDCRWNMVYQHRKECKNCVLCFKVYECGCLMEESGRSATKPWVEGGFIEKKNCGDCNEGGFSYGWDYKYDYSSVIHPATDSSSYSHSSSDNYPGASSSDRASNASYPYDDSAHPQRARRRTQGREDERTQKRPTPAQRTPSSRHYSTRPPDSYYDSPSYRRQPLPHRPSSKHDAYATRHNSSDKPSYRRSAALPARERGRPPHKPSQSASSAYDRTRREDSRTDAPGKHKQEQKNPHSRGENRCTRSDTRDKSMVPKAENRRDAWKADRDGNRHSRESASRQAYGLKSLSHDPSASSSYVESRSDRGYKPSTSSHKFKSSSSSRDPSSSQSYGNKTSRHKVYRDDQVEVEYE